MVASGAGAILPRGLFAQRPDAARQRSGRIDVHHHMFPPAYVRAVGGRGGELASRWSAQVSIDKMDRAGVAAAILSAVQVTVGDTMSGKDQKTRDLVRLNNEFGARCVQDYPRRFGYFAALPMMDADGALREIEYAYDTLKADGIGLWTSYLDRWVGAEQFWPIYEELDRRRAVVFYHPSHNLCCRNMSDQTGIIDYDLDTVRAIDSMLFNGTPAKYPQVRHIWAHAGGGFAVLAPREVDDYPRLHRDARAPNGVADEIRKFYWDTAHAGQLPTVDALRDLVPISQILYGSDVPIRDYALTDEPLSEFPHFSENDWQAINRSNAERLFPRLRRV
ncbi:MAG TPA: amidohydrolase family protein [Steroidobacteraceae bacterium]|nr:amidohydrolase family protein [Steroidobacteraceae bacterium]